MGTYPFEATDAGRSQSRRPKQKNDCTVRALATITGRDYDEVYDEVAALGRKSHQGFDFRKHAKDWDLEWTAFQSVKGEPRMTPGQFIREHPEGKYVLKVAKHVFAVIDGVAYDTVQSRDDRCVYGAWRLT